MSSTDGASGQRAPAKVMRYVASKLQRIFPASQSQGKNTLKQALPGWQITMIAIAGVIGVTIFSTQGEILRLAGPMGLFVSTFFVSVVAICVMDCLGELVILWPVANAMVEYVKTFVDDDLATVVGIAYWYTMSCVFTTLIIVAANLASYTLTNSVVRDLLFYGLIPLCLGGINVLGVRYYGLAEGVGGVVKLILVLTGIIFMIKQAKSVGGNNLEAGLQHEDNIASTDFQAFCIAVPLVSYGFIGTEIVSVTAFEAIDRTSLRFPARWVSYIVSTAYLVSALLQGALIAYGNKELQTIGPITRDISSTQSKNAQVLPPNFYASIVIVARDSGSDSLGWFFNGCIIYFCLSAANTALYAASRTLYGLTRDLGRGNIFRHFGEITQDGRVPVMAIGASFGAFYWLIFVPLKQGLEFSEILVIFSTTASIGGILVWASQCLAYIRYYRWFSKLRDRNTPEEIYLSPDYDRWNRQPNCNDAHNYPTLLTGYLGLKLIPAYLGLVGCLAIVFVFSTARWWTYKSIVPAKIWLAAFTGPITLFSLFVLIKLYHGRLFRKWYHKLPVDRKFFRERVRGLEKKSNAHLLVKDNGTNNATLQQTELGNIQPV